MQRLDTRRALVVWAVILTAVCLRVLASDRANSVYPIFSDAGRKWLASADLYGPPTRELDQFRYSPTVAAGFAPWGFLTDRPAGVLWRCLNAGVFVGGLALWWQWWRRERRGLAMLLLLVLPLAIGGLNNGQCNALIAGLALIATVAFGGGRLWLAAASVTIAVLFKGYPVALGLLFCIADPRRFAPRLALGLLAGFGLPYLLNRPEYVTTQYAHFCERVRTDDRTGWPIRDGYRDLHMLLRVVGLPLSLQAYRGVEVLAGLACAAIIAAGRRRGWGVRESAQTSFGLGAVWMSLCGPATESCTYVLLAPVLGRAVLEVAGRAWMRRTLVYASFGLFTLSAAIVWFPRWIADPVQTAGTQPFAALLLAVHVLIDCGMALRRPVEEPAADAVEPARAA
jgi:hypothetical protein